MPTTIDSLQIEIQSSSASASSGIKALAASLGELKKNGAVGTAVRNLGALAESLKDLTSAEHGANKINALARALSSLKNAGTFGTLVGNLKNLAPAMREISSINLDGLDTQVAGLATAIKPLTEIKSGGVGTLINSLAKLDKVTESLDESSIGAFAEKVKRLTEVLGPLSQQMTTIQAGIKGINSSVKMTNVTVQQANSEVNVTALNLNNVISVAERVVQALRGVVQAFGRVIKQAIQWDGISARFGRGFGAQAEETYQWIQRLNEEMGINVQQFMQYSSVYATMLTGFGVANEDAAKMALGYTELTYDIWAGYNDIYKTFDEAAEAVRSAIAGEVEPVRRAGFTIIESTLQQTAANHGLSISLENATEAQKSYLRYLTLVDQAHSQGLVGTYAKEMNTAEGLTRTLTQQLTSLSQAFGSLFLPILVRVIPYVQAFVELLTEGVHLIAGFFGVEIQPVEWGDYSEGIGNATSGTEDLSGAMDKAAESAKALKSATIGIDELNVISPNKDSGGSGSNPGAGGNGFDGLDVDSLWDESIFDGIQSQVDAIKEKFKDWLPVIAGIGTALAGLKLTNLLDDIDKSNVGLGKIGKVISIAGVTLAVGKLVWDFTGAYLETGNLGDLGKMLGTTAIGAAIGAWLAGPAGAAFVIAASGVVSLVRLAIDISEGNVEISDPQALTTLVVGALEAAIGGAAVVKLLKGSTAWSAIGTAIKSGLETAAIKGLYALDLVKPLLSGIGGAVTAAAGALGLSTGGFLALAAAIVGTIVLAIVDYDFTEIGETIGRKLGEAFRWVVDTLEIDSFWEGLAVLLNPIEIISRLISKTDWAQGIRQGISDAFDSVVEWFKGLSLLDKILLIAFPPAYLFKEAGNIGANLISGLWNGLWSGLQNLLTNIWEFVTGIINGFKEGFGIASPSTVMAEIGEFLTEGLWNGIKSIPILGDIAGWVEDVIQGFKDFFGISGSSSSETKEIGTSVTNGISNGMSATSIQTKLSTAWTNAKTWWDTKKAALKTYTPSIGSIFTTLSERWNSAKTWWNEKKSSLKSYTPPIGSIFTPLSERWTNARTWWNEKKTKLKEYTPSIGSIYDKLSERWTNARTWWNNKKSGLNSYTPTIGSIKDKLSSAWSSAKKWWNNNVRLSIPSLSFKVTYSNSGLSWAQKAIVNALGMQGWPKLSFAANGGMFDQGSMIWAGEQGAEIVANAAGGKTGVMNVQQMQDAVYEGVYAAVVAATRAASGGGSQAVNVYLDSRQITAAVEQRQRERGASIMGNQVYGY